MSTTSRRAAAQWAHPAASRKADIDVLIPTSGRTHELSVTLAGLAAQDDPNFRVIISDQSDSGVLPVPSVQAMCRVLEAQGRPVMVERHVPRRGMAEQRHFLLGLASADHVLFLDDDVWLEPGSLQRLWLAHREQGCGFVGYAVQGLSFLQDVRPHETAGVEMWGPEGVHPERIRPSSPSFSRWTLHNAANPTHLAASLNVADDDRFTYRVAWIGGCVLFDRRALDVVGGFDFWDELPPDHAGEDRVAQWRLMEHFGGAGILPSGAVHLEAPTTVRDRRVEASDVVFPEVSVKEDERSQHV